MIDEKKGAVPPAPHQDVRSFDENTPFSVGGLAAQSLVEDWGFACFLVDGIGEDGACTCGSAACKGAGKHPLAGSRSFKDATHVWATIERQWQARPWLNIAVATGRVSGLMVLDLDGPDAERWHDDQVVQHGPLPATFEVATGRGRHLYFALPEGVAVGSSAGRIAPHVDVRADGGYVVGPGSRHRSRATYLDNDHPTLAQVPEWLLAAAQAVADSVERRPDAGKPLDPALVDQPAEIAWYRDWLRHSAPIAVQAQGGQKTLIRVASVGRDRGLSAGAVLDALADDAEGGSYIERCEPPFDIDEAETLVGNAFRYAKLPHGNALIDVAFGGVDFQGVAASIPARGFPAMRMADFLAQGDRWPGWLAKGLLPAAGLALLYGEPGAGKTFVALDIALRVASTLPICDRRSTGAAVLYLALEGGGGLRGRLAAWQKINGAGDVPLFAYTGTLNLLDRPTIGALVAFIQANAVGLVVVDTLAQATPGADENSSQGMGAAVHALRRVIDATGCLVLAIHHPAKGSGDLRGWSGLRGAADTILRLDRDGAERTLRVEKQKDGIDGGAFSYALRSEFLDVDEDGDPVNSLVAEFRGAAPKALPKLTVKQREALAQVTSALANAGGTLSEAELRKALEAGGIERRRCGELLGALRTRGYLDRVDGGLSLSGGAP